MPAKIESWPPTWLTPVNKPALKKSRGWQVTDFVNTFAIQTKETVAGYSGDPMQMRPWQSELLNHLFAVNSAGKFQHRTALIGMARKNGKSALGSGIGLWSLVSHQTSCRHALQVSQSKWCKSVNDLRRRVLSVIRFLIKTYRVPTMQAGGFWSAWLACSNACSDYLTIGLRVHMRRR